MVNEKDLKTKYLRSKNREFTVHGVECFLQGLVPQLVKNFLVSFRLLGDSPASEFYVPTFQNTLSVPSS
jgi:hypothetical protein